MGAAASRTPAGGLILALLCAVAFTGTAWADVYIWRDPQTGARRMSNAPPPWIRDNTRGPKVEILRDGKPISAEAASANPQAPTEPSARQRAAGAAAAAASGRPQGKPDQPVQAPSREEAAEED
jgi:uncharacterized iron-regulated membrane protein